jgi:hypothetical protein
MKAPVIVSDDTWAAADTVANCIPCGLAVFLLLGWGLLFWQPIALKYGKRPVYLVSVLGAIGTSIWR